MINVEDYKIIMRCGRAYVRGINEKGKKIYGYKDTYRTPAGDFEPEQWEQEIRKAIEEAGEAELLEKIKEYCRKNCAWLRKESQIEEYAMECLADRAYMYWKDFKEETDMAEERQTHEGIAEMVPERMEFRLINPTEKGFLKHIEWNREELEAAVKEKVAEYSGMAYTEETMKAAKNDRAELNKLLKAIEDRRKKVKEAINKPYAAYSGPDRSE